MSRKCSPPAASRGRTTRSGATARSGKTPSGAAARSPSTSNAVCPECGSSDTHTIYVGLVSTALFYGFLKTLELGTPRVSSYRCNECEHAWRMLEVPVQADHRNPGALVGLGGQLQAAEGTGVHLSLSSLAQRQDEARDALQRQGRARRALEDQRIDRETEERVAPGYGRPGSNPPRRRG